MLCGAIAIASFAVLLLVGPRLIWIWWRGRLKGTALTAAPAPGTAANAPAPVLAARKDQSQPASAISREHLRSLIVEGKAMQARIADQRGPLAIVPAGLSARVADWEAKVSTVLESHPELLSHFRDAAAPASPFSALLGPAGKLHDQLGQRIKVLEAILRSIEA
jgi:hypothetical protein